MEEIRIRTESEEQIYVMNWAAYMANRDPRYSLLFHIPNGGKRGKAEAGRFRAEGVKSCVPDLMLPVPVGMWAGCFIEMKRTKGGRLSDEQKRWIELLRAQGYYVEVAYGGEMATRILEKYMEGDCE